MKKTIVFGFLCFAFMMVYAYGDQTRPVAVSPGSESGLVVVGQSCPTFSWSGVQWSNAYKVAVFPAVGTNLVTYEEMELLVSPVVSKEIHGPAFSWTPSEEERLTSGETYVWYIQAVDASGIGVWSEGRMFYVDETVRVLGVKKKLRESLKEYGMSDEDIERVVTNATAGLQTVEVQESSEMAPVYMGVDQGTEGTTNTYYGHLAGDTATGSYNSFFGRSAGYQTTGNYNTFVGYFVGRYNQSGGYNTFMGRGSGKWCFTGSYNTYIGAYSGHNATAGFNTMIGTYSGYSNTSGIYNTFLGTYSGYSNTTGSYNTFLGYYTGYNNTASYNTFIGYQAGRDNTTGNRNTFLGYYAGYNNTTGYYNTFLGYYAGYNNATTSENTYIGYYTGRYNTGTENTYLGYQAGNGTTGSDGDANTYIGHQAGNSSTTADYNTFVGSLSGLQITTGSRNTYIGRRAGEDTTTGYYNTALGYNAGASNITGIQNVFLGYQAGLNETGSNKLYIDSSSTTTPLIYGEFNNDLVRINTKLGVGRLPAANALEVNGNASKTTAGLWLANSDVRIKRDISDIEDAIGTVKKLHPIKFKYIDEWREKNPSIEDKYYYNFVAQEYRQVFPESVQGSGEYLDGDNDEILQLDSYNAQIVTIKAVQELIQKNEEQEKIINQLLEEIEILKALLHSTEKK